MERYLRLYERLEAIEACVADSRIVNTDEFAGREFAPFGTELAISRNWRATISGSQAEGRSTGGASGQ